MTPEEQEVFDWISLWNVEPVLSEGDARLIDLKVTVNPPPWVEPDDEDNETFLEVTFDVGAPSHLWEGLSDVQKESSKQTVRFKVWEDVVEPYWGSDD